MRLQLLLWLYFSDQLLRTPGIRRALKALAARKRANVDRVAAGKKPIVAGKQVSPGSIGLSKSKAKSIKANRS